MAANDSDARFQISVTANDKRMLEATAELEGLTMTEKLRQLIQQDYRARFGDEPTRKIRRIGPARRYR